MAENKNFEDGHCPNCGSQRADLKASHKENYHEHEFSAVTDFSILECRGCGTHYFRSSSSNSEDYHQWYDPETGKEEMEYNETVQFWPPAANRRPPDWADELFLEDRVLGSLFDDVNTALNNNLGVLAAIGMRTVFDRASELLGIEPQETFQNKLTALKDGDYVTGKDVSVLKALIDAGSAAAHRGWQPKPKQLNDMMSILEAFLHRAFFLEDLGAELDKHVPKRRKKAKQ